MKKSKIYIVMESTGQYEDRFERPFKAFTDKNKAEELVKKKNEYYDDLIDRYRSINFDVEEKMRTLFDRYLMDTDKEMYEAYQKADSHYNTDSEFNWNEFYDKENDFEEDNDLVKKYTEICGLTDEERDAILVYLEYEYNSHNNDGLPYYYVSRNALELEE